MIGRWVKIWHRNKAACSESNPVQSCRSESTTCRSLSVGVDSNSPATSDGCAKKLGSDVWRGSESIAIKVCSQISRKWNAIFESHVECLVQVGNGIELEAVGLQFEFYWWRPCGVTWDSSRTVVVIQLRRTSALETSVDSEDINVMPKFTTLLSGLWFSLVENATWNGRQLMGILPLCAPIRSITQTPATSPTFGIWH